MKKSIMIPAIAAAALSATALLLKFPFRSSRKPEEAVAVEPVQCSAKTAFGKRCKHMTTDPSGLCGQHNHN